MWDCRAVPAWAKGVQVCRHREGKKVNATGGGTATVRGVPQEKRSHWERGRGKEGVLHSAALSWAPPVYHAVLCWCYGCGDSDVLKTRTAPRLPVQAAQWGKEMGFRKQRAGHD